MRNRWSHVKQPDLIRCQCLTARYAHILPYYQTPLFSRSRTELRHSTWGRGRVQPFAGEQVLR